jgi:ATP-dependent DNA helicase RecG
MGIEEKELLKLIKKGESLTLEFKSDQKPLSDRELIAAVISLANTEGGVLLLGVEDNGKITGLHDKHKNISSLAAFIANKTTPSIPVKVETITTEYGEVAKINIDKSSSLVSTSEGLLQRRRMKADGTPEAVPFYPHEFASRQSSFRVIDPSASPVMEANPKNFNPVERNRLRESIRKFGGDKSLLDLADDEFDGALGLTINIDNLVKPTIAGLLLIGRENDIRRFIPSYEVAFQVLKGTEVRINEFFRKPVINTFEEIESLFNARVEEEEIEVGLFRVPVPNYDKRAFREAFVNALVHRDFSILGAVHVRLDDNGLHISNPGGFVEGVTIKNLLFTPPRPRNPLLADIIKRIGLAERTGRGIDRIFEGMLRYGRQKPDYSMSDSTSVNLFLPDSKADIKFLEMILENENKTKKPMPIESLIILSRLSKEKRLTFPQLMEDFQNDEARTRAAVEKLVEADLATPHGSGRGRSYTLSSKIYNKSGKKSAFIRQSGFDSIQQEEMVINYIKAHGSISRAETMELCRNTKFQAYTLLKKLKDQQRILSFNSGKYTRYQLK